ncbi:MAG: hypothetical protein QOI82_2226 [Actinomycetota bacterium]|jgi:hypothetical protein|nr:hypothetical protein [Actinomycetota bacterium]
MLVGAAFVPIPPLLVPEIAGGSAATDEPMRGACRDVVRRLAAAAPDEIVVVGAGDSTGSVEGSWDWRGFGVPAPDPAPKQCLPYALAIGSWLLDNTDDRLVRRYQSVAADLPADECAALGRELAGGDRRIGLLVCGDGSACRTEKAPGFFDPDAEAWDDAAVAALTTADPVALLALDAAVAARVLAAGRAPWQVLAGAAADGVFEARVDWADAPYGVMYIAGTWLRKDASTR